MCYRSLKSVHKMKQSKGPRSPRMIHSKSNCETKLALCQYGRDSSVKLCGQSIESESEKCYIVRRWWLLTKTVKVRSKSCLELICNVRLRGNQNLFRESEKLKLFVRKWKWSLESIYKGCWVSKEAETDSKKVQVTKVLKKIHRTWKWEEKVWIQLASD